MQMSHPVWVRGLKLGDFNKAQNGTQVAPRVGAWIETVIRDSYFKSVMSHPVWVRGLKHLVAQVGQVWLCRTPCGCVD